ncbi:MAG: aminoacyl-histidine dipeptidase [Coprobacter sp.]|nr:aminoacyl-histidine dipeptidase [Coprobacter sp.]
MELKELKPELIWRYFDEITQVPRPSKKEEKIRAYLKNFAAEHRLEVKEDATGNVLITKPATEGCEAAPAVILQSHMDMVCEKNNATQHDFENDPIEAYIDGEWVRANGTTLGADNGIGMAATLAVLASENLRHGKIEGLFTVDEETGLTGAYGIQPGFLTGDCLLNLDSEDEAEIFIGCAGGIDTTAVFSYRPDDIPENYFFMRISVGNLKGGHSGGDIHKGLGNANKILTRFLCAAAEKWTLRLCHIDGGNLRNAIPREASAVIGVPAADKEEVRAEFNRFIAVIENELGDVEPDMQLVMTSEEKPACCIDRETTFALIQSLNACPHGVIAMSRAIPGLVETSTNLASVKMMPDNRILVTTSQRSSTESLKREIASRVESVFVLAGAEVSHGDGYPGWKPNLDSSLLKIAQKAYEELYGITPAVKAIHAGLECGLFLEKYPHLDMISFGPTLRGVHSPDEKMHIPAVEKFWNHLELILRKVADTRK